MRLVVASLSALSAFAPAAMAQDAAPPAPSASGMAPPPATTAAPPISNPAPPASTPALGVAAAPEATAPAAPAPPPPPTDPAAIGVLSALETVCMPLVDGGNIDQVTKAAGYRKSGDNYVMKQKTYQLTLIPPGSNPNQCHVDIIHPVDPAGPIVVALHNWAAVGRGWTLYRNDKNVDAGQEYTTRSWETDADGKHSALVFTTIRKADGSPSKGGADTSELLYTATKTAG